MNANENFLAADAHVDAAAIAPLPNSRKIYVAGSRPDIRVPMREIAQSATADTPNPPITVYDCSGPYTDPTASIDIRKGLPGHGIGRNFHEEPQVLHYGTPGTGLELEPGMIFTIEPMVNAGKRHVKLMPDQWTVITKDRSLSAQWEHTILVTADGHEVLTRLPDDPL